MANTIGISTAVGNTYADTGVYYDKRFLDRLSPQLYFGQMGDKRPLPTRSGTLVKWHRLNKLTAVTTPLVENINPSEVTPGTTPFSAEPLTYGAWVKVSAELNLKAVNPIVEEIQDELADQSALSYDTIIRNILHNTMTNQFGGGAGSEGAVADSAVFNTSELRKAVYSLRKQNVKGYENNEYKGILHPASALDFTADTEAGGWIESHKYINNTPLMNGEIGKLYSVRFVLSTNIGTGTGATDETFRNFIFGKGAYGVTELAGNGVKTFRFNEGSTENPLVMYSTIGWKFMMAAKTLDANRGIEVYVGSAAE